MAFLPKPVPKNPPTGTGFLPTASGKFAGSDSKSGKNSVMHWISAIFLPIAVSGGKPQHGKIYTYIYIYIYSETGMPVVTA